MADFKEFRYFSIFNHEDEQVYLREKHKEGYKLVKVTGLGTYHFDQCDKEDVIYQLDYNQDGTNHKDEYIKMFEDCGWEYILEFAGYSYFRKSASEDMNDEIFCDEASRLAMLERVYKGRLLPLLVIFTACLLPQFILNIMNKSYVFAVFFGGVLLVYLLLFIYCGIHYNRKRNN